MILAIAAFLRLYQIATVPPALYSDEARNGNDILESMESGHFRVFYPANGGREGLFINLQAISVYLFGNQPWALRLPSAMFGILSVWVVYRLAARLFDQPVGWLASFFLATSFWHVMFSRIGLRAISAPFILVLSLYLLLDALERGARPGRMALAGAVFGLGFHTYTAFRVAPLLPGLVLAYDFFRVRKARRGAQWAKGVAVFTGAAVAVVMPLVLYFVKDPEMLVHRSAEISVFRKPNPLLELAGNALKMTGMIFTRGDPMWQHNIAFRPMVFWPVAVLFAVGLVLSVRALAIDRARRLSYALVLVWLVAGALPAVMTTERMPSAIRSILMLPAIGMLAAVGASALWVRWRSYLKRPWPVALAAVLFAALCYEPYHTYFDLWAKDPQTAMAFNAEAAENAERIQTLPASTPKYVVVVAPGEPIGMPPPTETVMFLTRSATQRQQEEANIHYVFRKAGDPDGVDFCKSVSQTRREGAVFCMLILIRH